MYKNLFIVATPIGNLDDISFRAINTLKEVDLILAEDTRHSKKLLDFYQIDTKLQAFHEHNEKQQVANIIKLLATKSIALISDAGTPLINDPGFNLVRAAKKEDIKVIPIPGSSSVIAALSASGLPSNNFCFLGFVPTKTEARIKFLNKITISSYTNIFFESPKRILNTMELINTIFTPNREMCLAKELTKTFETIITGNSEKIINYLTSDTNSCRGEFVLLVSPNNNDNDKEEQLNHILPILKKELSNSTAAKIAAKITGLNKKYCYEKLL